MNVPRSAAEVLDEHTTLELECIDRMYLNVYVPMLQTGAGTWYFFREARGKSGTVVGAGGADDAALPRGAGTLCDAGLIHANGRLHDPRLGRYLSLDPAVSDPTSSQD